MKRIIYIFLILLVPGGVFSSQLQNGQKAAGENERLFSEIAKAATYVTTLKSDFVQERHLGMLEDVLISKGRFYYKKQDRLRWEVTKPVSSGFAVSGKQAKRWDAKSGRTQTFEVYQVPFIKLFTDQVFAWATADFKQLQKDYNIEVLGDAPVDLKLVPVRSQEKKYLAHFRIAFTADASHVKAVEVHETGGDFTRIRFYNTIINTPLPDTLFD
ncbi:MAG: outer membrane lipoprotein carrier protein LolA [Deltaproteobacteria bacterium]|jgi:outer membrane lipoprotein-sorting protein|nr:outer membrane lipoprotein carrier protein LolA [Deltaproteobacteria bacterium]